MFFKTMQDECNFARPPPWRGGGGGYKFNPDQNHQTITIYGYAKFTYTKLSKAPYTVFKKMSLAMVDKCTPSSVYMVGHNNLRSRYLIYPPLSIS